VRTLGLNRASLYYRWVEVSAYEVEVMALIDRQYLRTPFYGSRRMTAWLQTQDHMVNRKRVQRLMRLMGIGVDQHGRMVALQRQHLR
jgi:putative transposase